MPTKQQRAEREAIIAEMQEHRAYYLKHIFGEVEWAALEELVRDGSIVRDDLDGYGVNLK